MGNVLQKFLTVVGITCLVFALMPSSQTDMVTAADGSSNTRKAFKLGIPVSPLVIREETISFTGRSAPLPADPQFQQVGTGSRRWTFSLSLSFGLLIVGVASLLVGHLPRGGIRPSRVVPPEAPVGSLDAFQGTQTGG